ncbi:PRC-barrel domain-containing protein [Catenulispora subtropica]|uniref:PRC-barrel domain-containing protein n=1 Tax=Catenulispora subtropica TaxID=450798 RepID=A0ABP5E2Q8_9ACTN
MRDTVEFVIGTDVRCAGEECGTVEFVVVDPVARRLTHLVVQPEPPRPARLVPVKLARLSPGRMDLTCTMAEFEALEPAVRQHFLQGSENDWGYRSDQVLAWPFFGLAPAGTGITTMEYPMLPEPQPEYRLPPGEAPIRRGDPVRATDGRIGKVRGLAVDRFDGMVTHVLLDEGHLWGRKLVAIPVGAVSGVDESGVSVRLAKDEIRDLPPVDLEDPASLTDHSGRYD